MTNLTRYLNHQFTKEDMVVDRKEVIKRLQELQKSDGYISREKLVDLGKEVNMPLSELYGIVTFYSFFKLNKAAKNVIQVCDGTACHVRGSEPLMDEVQKLLNITHGQMTPDGKFSMDVVRCLGMCASAPLLKINDELYPKIKPEDIKSILEKY
jgi:NADP-reducing hydrogenase subunit HndA